MATAAVGTVTGTFTRPGLSKNRRKYTRAVVDSAVRRMQARLADPNGRPLTMLTHHAAGGDSLRIAGSITKVWQLADGTAKFSAELADNDAGRGIAALVSAERPHLRNVSIRGWWLGDVHTEVINGTPHEVGDDLEIDGVDFTKSPGVDDARIDAATLAETTDGLARTPITESVEETSVTVTDTAPTTEASSAANTPNSAPYADPGYQSDGKKRYPIDTKAHIRAAWSYINQADNAKPYTAAQLKRIKGRIRAAAKKAGINISEELQALTAAVTESLEDAYASISIDNGPATVSIAGYTGDPEQIPAIARKIALGALAALGQLDPDNDGDIDLADPDVDDADDPTSTATADEGTATATGGPVSTATETTTAAKPVAEMTDEEFRAEVARRAAPVVEPKGAQTAATESTSTAAAAATEQSAAATENETAATAQPERNLTDADVAALAAAIKGDAGTPAGATSTSVETTTSESASESSAVDKLVEQIAEKVTGDVLDQVGKTLGRRGVRRGLVRPAEESASGTTKPLHEMSEEEFRAHNREAWDGLI